MQIDVFHHFHGCEDGRCGPFEDSLFLLDAAGTVLGCRSNLEFPVRGADFFASLHTDPAEREALFESLTAFTEDSYLMQCGDVPVLILRAGFPAARLLVAVVPPPGLRPLLQFPAAYVDALGQHLVLSPASLRAYRAPREKLLDACNEWLIPYQQASFFNGSGNDHGNAVAYVLAGRISRLVALCGVSLEYDLSGIGAAPLPNADLRLFSTTLTALFLLARRAAPTHGLSLYIERRGPDAPAVHATLYTDIPQKDFTELAGLAAIAERRGMLFDVTRDLKDPSLWHIAFTFCPKEISLQGVRQPTPTLS
jgi:hypothetical protein